MSLGNHVAIITGASSGIGEAMARVLAGVGVRVVAAARRKDRLEALAKTITEDGGRVLPVVTDVTRREDVESLATAAIDAYGRIDILVNNAGVMPLSPIRELLVDDWDRMIDVNIRGVLYGIAAVLPTMLAQRSGHIVNVSSVAGRRPLPAGTIYSATKFAVRAISQGLHLELSASDNIRITDIEPGVVATELMDHIPAQEVREGFQQRWSEKTPLSSEDVANAVLYAVTQPRHVNVNEILVRPTDQPT